MPVAQWISLPEAARRLDKSVGHLRRHCRAWAKQGKARQINEPGKRSYWQVRGLAPHSEHGATAEASAVGAPAAGGHLRLAGEDMRSIPEAHRAVVLQRKAILDAWQVAIAEAIGRGGTKEEATESFLRSRPGLSRRTLYRYLGDFQRSGFAGLMDARKLRDAADADDPFVAEVRRTWLRLGKPKLTTCYDIARLEAQEQGWSLVSYRRVCQLMRKIEPAIQIMMREGKKAFEDKIEPFIERDYSALRSNEIWNADHHRFDVIVVVGERMDQATGEIKPVFGRPWLSAVQDCASRKITGYVIRAEDPNTDVILEVFRLAFASHGVPEIMYCDNGKDFDAVALAGETKQQRRKRRKLRVELDPERMQGVYASFGIQHRHAQKFHGQSKPIERWFGTVKDRFCRLQPTFCGGKPDEKPYGLQDRLDAGEAPTLAEFVASFARWIEADYHGRIHQGDAMDGLTPSQAFDAKLVEKRTAPEKLLEVMLQKRFARTVGQAGVCYKGLYFGDRDLALARWFGKQVFIRINDRDLSSVSVWSPDDDFICAATQNQKLPFNAGAQELREALNEKRRHRKAIVAGEDAKRALREPLADRLVRAAQDKAKSQPPPPEVEPAVIKPIRSPLESELAALQCDEARATMRKAVGDGTPHPRAGTAAVSRFAYQPTFAADDADAAPAGFRFAYTRMAENSWGEEEDL